MLHVERNLAIALKFLMHINFDPPILSPGNYNTDKHTHVQRTSIQIFFQQNTRNNPNEHQRGLKEMMIYHNFVQWNIKHSLNDWGCF